MGTRGPRSRAPSRRVFLRLAAGGALGAALIACGARPEAPAPPRRRPSEAAVAPERIVPPAPSAPPAPPRPRFAEPPPPRAVPPPGRIERTLLPGTEWATPLMITNSGVEGARVMVLGGVHGNEPGGWRAAESIATWDVAIGSLLVIPRANVLATFAFARTLPELGDLNRLYPGAVSGRWPMARMADAIVATAREFQVDVLLDLHESWGFYAERPRRGTAFLGQTVTKGEGPMSLDSVRRFAEAVNAEASEREQLIVRRRSLWRGAGGSATPQWIVRGSSSLSLGGYVPGLTPVLVEMGQQSQPEARRAELHRLVVGAALAQLGMA